MMITEQETLEFLKTKDKNYIDSLWTRLHADNDQSSHKMNCCPKCGSISFKKNDKYKSV